jgi:hypothetical protein
VPALPPVPHQVDPCPAPTMGQPLPELSLPAPVRPHDVLRVSGDGCWRAQHLVAEQEGHVPEPVTTHGQAEGTEDVPDLVRTHATRRTPAG